MSKVFISYRRDDSESIAGRISDRLFIEFGEDNIFFDTDIGSGVNWVQAIKEAIQQSQVIVVIIGENWLRELKRRQKTPDDAVRMEIEAAIAGEVQLLPVLVGQARMPGERELPANIRALHDINAVRVNHHSFHSNIRELQSAIRSGFEKYEKRALERAQKARDSENAANTRSTKSGSKVSDSTGPSVSLEFERLTPPMIGWLGLPVSPIGLAPLSRRRNIRQRHTRVDYLLPNRILLGTDSVAIFLVLMISSVLLGVILAR